MYNVRCTKDEKRVIFIVGPTASGKSEIAIALAKKLKSEIISCDSMQVYKGMAILSCQPDKKQRKEIRHHLISSLNPTQDYSAAVFCKKAIRLIEKLCCQDKIPIFTGGTGFYVKALIDGLFEDISADWKLRRRLQDLALKYGNKYLYRRLEKIDSQAAEKIHPNDLRRIIRALEVFAKFKQPISHLQRKTEGIVGAYKIMIFAVELPRAKLYARINQRVEQMFQSGIVQEVKQLLKEKLSLTAAKALGIKEIAGYLAGEHDLVRAKYLLKKNTRHYAKRQLTWFRKDKRIIWLDGEKSPHGLVKIICQKIGRN